MYYEGPKRQGRFIKKGAKVLDKVSLKPFSFQEISSAKVISHDNYKRTIIHSQYHEEQELDESVRPPDRFNQDLTPPEQMRPVIVLQDFTKDWERDKMLRKDRVSRSEDEEFDYELEAQRQAEREKILADEEQARVEARQAAKTGLVHAESEVAASKSGGDQVGIAEVVEANKKSIKKSDEADGAAAAAETEAAVQPPLPQRTLQEQASDDFIPVQNVRDPEQEAARVYQARMALEQEQAAALAELQEAASAAGYEDGFRAGEEKGELQARQQAGQMFAKVGELIREFANLKQAILDNVQENFYELCQAMAESLIQREFSINPETFVTVMRRAISETVEAGKFRLHVHPEFFERLQQVAPNDIRECLVKDPQVAPGDFKIESQLSVVDVSVSKLLGDLLAQADLQLFTPQEKAS